MKNKSTSRASLIPLSCILGLKPTLGALMKPAAHPREAVTYDSASPLSTAKLVPGGSDVLAVSRIVVSRDNVVGTESVGTVS